MGKKTIEVTLEFCGDGKVISKDSGSFHGGVVHPNLEKGLQFCVHRQVLDENGILNPVFGEGPVEGSFQINIYGGSEGYRELGKYFLGLAELDASDDPDYHDHFDDLISEDGKTNLHVIVRKDR